MEVVTLRKRLSEEQAKVSKLQSEISVTRVELSNAKTAPPATESQAPRAAAPWRRVGALSTAALGAHGGDAVATCRLS